MIEKALSIRQPWAQAILYWGKRIENRDWKHPPTYRGPILIHASSAKGKADIEDGRETCHMLYMLSEKDKRELTEWPPLPAAPPMQFGGIVGRANLVDVITDSLDHWFFGPLGFVLADVEPLPFYRCKGALGFFDVDMSLPPDPEPVKPEKPQRVKVAKPSNQGRLF